MRRASVRRIPAERDKPGSSQPLASWPKGFALARRPISRRHIPEPKLPGPHSRRPARCPLIPRSTAVSAPTIKTYAIAACRDRPLLRATALTWNMHVWLRRCVRSAVDDLGEDAATAPKPNAGAPSTPSAGCRRWRYLFATILEGAQPAAGGFRLRHEQNRSRGAGWSLERNFRSAFPAMPTITGTLYRSSEGERLLLRHTRYLANHQADACPLLSLDPRGNARPGVRERSCSRMQSAETRAEAARRLFSRRSLAAHVPYACRPLISSWRRRAYMSPCAICGREVPARQPVKAPDVADQQLRVAQCTQAVTGQGRSGVFLFQQSASPRQSDQGAGAARLLGAIFVQPDGRRQRIATRSIRTFGCRRCSNRCRWNGSIATAAAFADAAVDRRTLSRPHRPRGCRDR